MKLFRGKKEDFPIGRFANPFLTHPRRPTHTFIETHRIADDWFLRKFGVAARSRTLMCTTNPNQAYTYGTNVRVIKPNPPYKLISSCAVDDFLDIRFTVKHRDDKDAIERWLESKDYYCVDDLAHLRDDALVEVMVFCETYDVCKAEGFGPYN